MRTTKNMDYIYTDGQQEILIESLQKNTRSDVIAQYVQCRKENNMTQADLAKRSGISRTNITRFESGDYNPSLEMMVKIAAALGTELDIKLVSQQSPPETVHQ